MRISDWSSDVCSSDLVNGVVRTLTQTRAELTRMGHDVDLLTPLEFRTLPCPTYPEIRLSLFAGRKVTARLDAARPDALHIATEGPLGIAARAYRSEEHTSELQSLMRISYAVLCLKQKQKHTQTK